MGKAKLLYKLAKAVTAQLEGVVREVVYPVVSEETLEDVIREAETDEKHEQQVKGLLSLSRTPAALPKYVLDKQAQFLLHFVECVRVAGPFAHCSYAGR